jgi:S-adenosylmethionine-dependent methyltransferase
MGVAMAAALPQCDMKKMITHADRERFERGAQAYAAYLEKPEGRLRVDLAFANLQEFLPQSKAALVALDVGGGTGQTAVRLASLGCEVTLLDSSREMVEIAARVANPENCNAKITLKRGDATQIADLFHQGSFDVILCHNVLEFLDDPDAVMRGIVTVARGSSALLSVVVRNRGGEVLKAAISQGDLESAGRGVDAQWGCESLYGGRVRLFTPDEIVAMLKKVGLNVIAARGVRVLADYLPPQISREADYERIFELERKLGQRPEFTAVARYTHYLAHPANPA